jgi:hypothetical protein
MRKGLSMGAAARSGGAMRVGEIGVEVVTEVNQRRTVSFGQLPFRLGWHECRNELDAPASGQRRHFYYGCLIAAIGAFKGLVFRVIKRVFQRLVVRTVPAKARRSDQQR